MDTDPKVPGTSADGWTTIFRKERINVFESRFTKVPYHPDSKQWQLSGDLVFGCKATSGKILGIRVGQTSQTYTWELGMSPENLPRIKVSQDNKFRFNIDESELEYLSTWKESSTSSTQKMTAREKSKHADLQAKSAIVVRLCANHAKASTRSPFISFTDVDNFQASTAYPGEKLSIELKSGRKAFPNPNVSGVEKEHLVLGNIKKADCRNITYHGRVDPINQAKQTTYPGSLKPKAQSGPSASVSYPRSSAPGPSLPSTSRSESRTGLGSSSGKKYVRGVPTVNIPAAGSGVPRPKKTGTYRRPGFK